MERGRLDEVGGEGGGGGKLGWADRELESEGADTFGGRVEDLGAGVVFHLCGDLRRRVCPFPEADDVLDVVKRLSDLVVKDLAISTPLCLPVWVGGERDLFRRRRERVGERDIAGEDGGGRGRRVGGGSG